VILPIEPGGFALPSSQPPMMPMSMPVVPSLGARTSYPPRDANVRYVLAATLGVVFSVVLGLAGVVAWRHAHLPVASKSGAPERLTATAVAPPTQTLAAEAPAVPFTALPVAAGESTPGTERASPRVLLKIAPETAIVTVDGTELGPGAREVSRPGDGKTRTVLVRAPGYDDQSLAIDGESPDTIDVVLEHPQPAWKKVPLGQPGPAPTGKPAQVPGLPENPY
jgi:hypothetical protein